MDYKLAIRKIIREQVEKILSESFDDYEDMISEMPDKIFWAIKNREKIKFDVIPKDQYLKALREFMEYNSLMRFPFKYINQWKELVIENIIKLDTINAINGHSEHFPFHEFYDVFDYNRKAGVERDGEFSRWIKKQQKEGKDYSRNEWLAAFDFLIKVYDLEKSLPKFSNGQFMVSDAGLKPLGVLAGQLMEQTDPNEILLTLDRVMNVAHPRSDLAELFIEGGSHALEYISAAE